MKLLFASSEIFPLAKTGGLADVAGALPIALEQAGIDIRLLMPAYRGIAAQTGARPVANLGDPFGLGATTILEGRVPGNRLPIWLVDTPGLFDRDGGPYQGAGGTDWPDNDMRFGLLSWAAARLGQKNSPLSWKPDILHAHDWQTGLAPAFLKAWNEPDGPGVVFTIHNMAYQGLFPPALVSRLGLPWSLYTMEGFEYWNQLSYLKAGLVFADKLTTVSPTYAREIQTAAFGFGMDGVLARRATDLSGILNGADYTIWDPRRDPHLPHHYGVDDAGPGKAANKAALQREMGLPEDPAAPLMVVVSRLSDQKGMDLLLAVMPAIIAQGGQLAVVGSGEHALEEALLSLAKAKPSHVAIRVGYSEELAHRLQAGGDILLMPSRFEPCGLTQIYALRYGTLPIVHRTGGLADTVVDASYDSLTQGAATGFLFEPSLASALQWAIERAIGLYRHPAQWARLRTTAMRQDFDWNHSALRYLSLYRTLRPTAETDQAKSRPRTEGHAT
ncbi:glycogen synthase GlgA [Telmatospirillum siberiense]|uniref:Glycogen synthase n=1 Tax=Telmatospirillum siberiense TaxID=382514 RepID=A0A2N3Q1M6_9PROT|nr:glycogen synthase GlgA [Telmatospirillum siberiense]PKU26555.1 glycogen synthase GlgA [Telmatospirillum siberiense]